MKRYACLLAMAAALALIALVARNHTLLAVVLLVTVAAIGLGVALPQLRLFVEFICRGQTGKKQVALTFDDGPDPKSTPQLLALLRERNVPAAFFGIGSRVDASPELARQIVREGHLLENHSYTHSHFTNFYATKRLRAELARTQTAIEQSTSVAPRYYRPPNGLSNVWTYLALKQVKLRPVGWTIRSLDTTIASPEKIASRITKRISPGAIILLHDGGIPADKLLATVRTLLDDLRARDYEAVRLDVLIGDADGNEGSDVNEDGNAIEDVNEDVNAIEDTNEGVNAGADGNANAKAPC